MQAHVHPIDQKCLEEQLIEGRVYVLSDYLVALSEGNLPVGITS